MEIADKLKILTEGAKYDVACTSSGVNRSGKRGAVGSASACGICHSFTPDGRCISLLKLLMTNVCIYDCAYCVNRRSNDVPRASFSPKEIAELTMDFYRRNYIEGLFLSSGIVKSPDYTTELLIETLRLLREQYRFNGYIHVKAIPGASQGLLRGLGHLTDRISVNIELPSEKSLVAIAPDKSKNDILKPMKQIKEKIRQSKEEVVLFRNAPSFVPAGQSTQLIVGATPESDSAIVHLAQGLYNSYGLKRVFYSAYIPVGNKLPVKEPPLLREHRLYQADWLLRFYGFSARELFDKNHENLSLHLDPKCHWALKHLEHFPVEINRSDFKTLLRVPGIGQQSAQRIMSARKVGSLDFNHLKKIGVVLKRAKYFITCNGKMHERLNWNANLPDMLEHKLADNQYEQLNLFS
ncbi:MAG: putative DNA modification/repair radical SAM protein [Defluviitaleaceae bacterium]|nr:putative DNA modification/repair radical SAM protein [Defluviitaleaceae bacterium]